MANIVDLNLCLFVGQIGADLKFSKCSNGKGMATFSLCVNSFIKELADATERTNSQTYIRILCFDKKQIEYLKNVHAKQGQRAFIVGRLSSFKNEHRGITFMTNNVVCRSIMILKTSDEKSIDTALELAEGYYKCGEISEKAYKAITASFGKVQDEEEQ